MQKILLLTALALAIVSCQKEIDVDLNEANPQLVIEANYTAEDSTVRVLVSMTANYFGTSEVPKVDGATVTITDAQGNVTAVPGIGNGQYELAAYIPDFGTQYTMSVIHDGTQYTAQSYMHSPVQLDPITYEFFPSLFGQPEGYRPFMSFQDPAATTDHYIVMIGKNGTLYDNITDRFFQDDELTDGNPVLRPLFGGEKMIYQIGDTILMEMQTIDERAFEYYAEIYEVSTGGSAAPANPTWKWTNKALGYFSAYGVSRQSVVVQ